jgi:hypothetical protein
MKTFVVIAVTCFSLATLAQTQSSCANPKDAQSALIGAFRVINTAEVNYRMQNGSFANMTELAAYPTFKKFAEHLRSQAEAGSVELGGADDPLPGYTVRLLVSSDGKAYSLAATKKAEPCGGVGAATDDRGVIYLVEPIR